MSRFSDTSQDTSVNWPQVYLGVALTTLATIVLELSLTRIFSVVFYYHFAFLAVSIALFGFGAGGLLSYAFRGRSRWLFWRLGVMAVVNSGVVVLTLAFVLTRKGDLTSGTLALVYLMSALPFFFAGTVLSTAIAETVERVERIYFYDLIGAAGGCLLLVPLLDSIGGPNTVIGAAILFAAASAIWFTAAGSLRGRVVAVAVALGLVGLVVINTHAPVLDVKYAKGVPLLDEFYVKWNSFSRIALAEDAATGRTNIHIDADTVSGIADLDLDRLSDADRRRLLENGPGLAYLLRPRAKTLIIGAGGGWNVTRALAAGSTDVTGVELNPIIANEIMRDRYSAISGGLYFRPGVHIKVGDGRSFLRRNGEHYGVLQVSLGSTRDSSAAGARALSETSLYTTDALDDYLSHLDIGGVITFTHWSFEPPRESLRLAAIAVTALSHRGQLHYRRNVIVVREHTGGHALDTVLVSREPFGDDDVETVRRAVRDTPMEAVYLPGDAGANVFAGLLGCSSLKQYLEGYPYDVRPVSDNRPFFFYTAQFGDLMDFVRHGASDTGAANVDHAVPALVRLVGISLLATAIMLTLPPLFLGGGVPRDRFVTRFLWYFVFVGVGYIVVQVALIQTFILFLEHPTYALTVITFSMLLSSGFGSYFSRRLIGPSSRSLMGALATASLLIALLAVLIPPLISGGAGWPLWVKVIVSVLLITPAGFVMGMIFPAGMTRLGKRHRPSVRWAWSLNAAASVLGSATAMFLAIHLGLRETLLIGGVMYLCALVSIGDTGHEPITVEEG